MSLAGKRKVKRLHRFTLKQYERMGRLGILTKADRVVLLDGLVVKKITKGPRHETVKHRVFKALEALLVEGWHYRMENPLRLPRPAGARKMTNSSPAVATTSPIHWPRPTSR